MNIIFQKFINCVLVIFLLSSCRNTNKYNTKDVMSIRTLLENARSFHGKAVAVDGIFFYQFENVSICSSSQLYGMDRDCLWLGWYTTFNLPDSILSTYSGKKCIVSGVIDTTSRGHLGAYIAAMKGAVSIELK